MGKVRTLCAQTVTEITVLAFFSVVASSPNLSTNSAANICLLFDMRK